MEIRKLEKGVYRLQLSTSNYQLASLSRKAAERRRRCLTLRLVGMENALPINGVALRFQPLIGF